LPVPDESTPGGATAVAGRSSVCLLLPGGGGALWLPPGEQVCAAVRRVASELGVAASELVTGGGRVVLGEWATHRRKPLGTALILRLVWRARSGGKGGGVLTSFAGCLSNFAECLTSFEQSLTVRDVEKLITVCRFSGGNNDAKTVAAEVEAGATPTRMLMLCLYGIGPEGVHTLPGALPSATAPQELYLRGQGNPFYDEGGRAFARALPRTLEVLDLDHKSIGGEGARALARTLPRTLRKLRCVLACPRHSCQMRSLCCQQGRGWLTTSMACLLTELVPHALQSWRQ
jgi:hypothetical protein